MGREKTLFFFFNDTATTEIYTLSLHDALPIYKFLALLSDGERERFTWREVKRSGRAKKRFYELDRKSTRLNSSHANISYAVFCLKKKKTHIAEIFSPDLRASRTLSSHTSHTPV